LESLLGFSYLGITSLVQQELSEDINFIAVLGVKIKVMLDVVLITRENVVIVTFRVFSNSKAEN